MIQKEITITNSLGIHARPASMIVKTATGFQSEISLIKDSMTADAKSIMSVMMLAAAHKSKIIIQANGPDEEEAAESIEELFRINFNEE